MKKLFSIIIAAAMLLCLLPSFGIAAAAAPETEADLRGHGALRSAPAAAEVYSGACGEDLTWTLDTGSGRLTVSGTGEMYDYNDGAPWLPYASEVLSAEIGDGVTRIGNSAFSGCSSLAELSIGSGLASVGYNAFYNCPIARLTVDSSMFGTSFKGMTTLESLVIGDHVQSVGSAAFNGCTSLSSLTLGSGLKNIGSGAFFGCTSLQSVTLPEGLEQINEYAFRNCSSLTSINIPGSVTMIGTLVFCECPSMRSFDVSPDNACFSSADGVLFDKERTMIICFPAGRTGQYVIPQGVTTIDLYAFAGCSLSTVMIPESIESIRLAAFKDSPYLTAVKFNGCPPGEYYGGYAFSGCPYELKLYYLEKNAYAWSPNGETTWRDNPIAVGRGCVITYTGDYTGTDETFPGYDVELPDAGREDSHYEFTAEGEPWDGRNVCSDAEVTVTLELNRYNVTFVDYDGTVLKIEEVVHGGSATAPSVPNHPGLAFVGWDTSFTEITADVTVTAMYEPAPLMGDADGNGVIDTVDALLVLRCALGISGDHEGFIPYCDMDGSGVIDTVDALLILRLALGIE